MTLISFYDEDPLDNAGDLLYFLPERCVFIGNDAVMTKRHKRALQDFVLRRELPIRLEFRSLPAGDIEQALCLLRELIMDYPDSIFDVTGGTELLLSAAGIIAGNYDIPMYQRKSKSGQILWQYGCEVEPGEAALTVREVVELHAGAIPQSVFFTQAELTDALWEDVSALWEIAKEDPLGWNNTCEALSALAKDAAQEDPLQAVVESQVEQKAFYRIHETIFAGLLLEGYILDFDDSWGGISFRFRDIHTRQILTKAGTLLELYTCMAANWATDRATGLLLDWDGKLLDGEIETRNELDVMLTEGITPICISCKNGSCSKEALYELETVGRRFAGRYAKKILVASYIDQNENARKSLEQRARDMKITLIADVHKLSLEEFSQKLRKAAN